MAASIASPIAISDPSTAMNPTTTEHDFRFPRRPFESNELGKTNADENSPGDLRLQELNLDFTKPDNSTMFDFLQGSTFPSLQHATAGNEETLEQMQESDPLATQVWKFYRNTKQNLPSQERMVNLTWRMMHMSLRRKQAEDARYVSCMQAHRGSNRLCSRAALREPGNTAASNVNVPSGIAQLRKTSDQNLAHADPMNLDDFIFPENVATPAGLAATPSPDGSKQEGEKSAHTTAAAIPIKSRKVSSQHFVPQSVPVPAHQRNQDEFAYVTRHHRKTSIDERRVSAAYLYLFAGCKITSQALFLSPYPWLICYIIIGHSACKYKEN